MLFRLLGRRLFFLLILVGALLGAAERFGVTHLTTPLQRWWTQRPIPRAPAGTFTVALTQLGGDDDHSGERIIREQIKEIPGIEVLAIDRTITSEAPSGLEETLAEARTARQYLAQSGAQVLLWGTVLGRGDRTVFKLYWVSALSDVEPWRRYEPTEALQLPDTFVRDLGAVLNLLVAEDYRRFSASRGQFIADPSPPFQDRVRNLIDHGGQALLSAGDRAQLEFILGSTLVDEAEQNGDRRAAEEAIARLEASARDAQRDRQPFAWANIQKMLGVAYATRAELVDDVDDYRSAIRAYEATLGVWGPRCCPAAWAAVKSNLCNARKVVGYAQDDGGILAAAVSDCRGALSTPEVRADPLAWGGTLLNLSGAYALLGDHLLVSGHGDPNGMVYLRRAVSVARRSFATLRAGRYPFLTAKAAAQWCATMT